MGILAIKRLRRKLIKVKEARSKDKRTDLIFKYLPKINLSCAKSLRLTKVDKASVHAFL